MNLKKTLGLATIGLTIIFANTAFAERYIVSSNSWGKKQERAISKMGGTVTFSHKATGIAFVDSSDPNFAANAKANKIFKHAFADQSVKWQKPSTVIAADAIDPSLEFAYFLQWHLPAIDADDAWAAGCTGAGVRVGIIDGGIDDAHPDLIPNLDVAASRSFVPGFAFNEDVVDPVPGRTFWHGTHVAGIVGAANNGGGVLGVAPEVTLVGIKALHGGSGYFSWLIEAVIYAADEADIDIINMSLGAFFQKSEPGGGAFAALLNRVMNYAARKGVLAISAAGNDAINWDRSFDYINVPAESGNGVAVSSTAPIGWAFGNEEYDRPASYTNYGQSLVHVSAPGGDFAYPGNEFCTFAPCWALDMVLSTNFGGSYTWSAGTSMAAPVAAGVAALIKANHPNMSVGALKNALANTATDSGKPGHDMYHGRGFVNAMNACNF